MPPSTSPHLHRPRSVKVRRGSKNGTHSKRIVSGTASWVRSSRRCRRNRHDWGLRPRRLRKPTPGPCCLATSVTSPSSSPPWTIPRIEPKGGPSPRVSRRAQSNSLASASRAPNSSGTNGARTKCSPCAHSVIPKMDAGTRIGASVAHPRSMSRASCPQFPPRNPLPVDEQSPPLVTQSRSEGGF